MTEREADLVSEITEDITHLVEARTKYHNLPRSEVKKFLAAQYLAVVYYCANGLSKSELSNISKEARKVHSRLRK